MLSPVACGCLDAAWRSLSPMACRTRRGLLAVALDPWLAVPGGTHPCGCPGPLALVKEGEMHPKKYNSDLSIRYKRQSLRMPKHNYGWTGTYFVTIRAVQREPIFETPELCTILIETWKSLPERFVGATLDEFVIMPDHIHFIIELEGNVEKPVTLGDVIGAYKSLTTVAWIRHIKATGMERSGIIWQRNYFERDIRDAHELEQTRQYIRDNPAKQNKE